MPEQENDNPIIQVTCANFHISYFDKKEICPDSGTIVRRVREGAKSLDEIILTCKTAGCGLQVVKRVDCEGYR